MFLVGRARGVFLQPAVHVCTVFFKLLDPVRRILEHELELAACRAIVANGGHVGCWRFPPTKIRQTWSKVKIDLASVVMNSR